MKRKTVKSKKGKPNKKKLNPVRNIIPNNASNGVKKANMLEISDVRVELIRKQSSELRAFCSIVIDNALAVHGFKVVEEPEGLFIAMPSIPITFRCHKCRAKNFVKASFCAKCGARLRYIRDTNISVKIHEDIAYPINDQCRELIQEKVLAAYKLEIKKTFRVNIQGEPKKERK